MVLPSFPERVNERAVRLAAGTVVATLGAAWVTGWAWLLPVLGAGFALRAAWGPRASALGRASGWLAARLWQARPVAGPPKRFAQGIGAVCLLSASALLLVDQRLAWGAAGLVAVFGALEAVSGFCLGCWIYGRFLQQGRGSAVCEECVVARRPGGSVTSRGAHRSSGGLAAESQERA
jgi:hypothetical protein